MSVVEESFGARPPKKVAFSRELSQKTWLPALLSGWMLDEPHKRQKRTRAGDDVLLWYNNRWSHAHVDGIASHNKKGQHNFVVQFNDGKRFNVSLDPKDAINANHPLALATEDSWARIIACRPQGDEALEKARMEVPCLTCWCTDAYSFERCCSTNCFAMVCSSCVEKRGRREPSGLYTCPACVGESKSIADSTLAETPDKEGKLRANEVFIQVSKSVLDSHRLPRFLLLDCGRTTSYIRDAFGPRVPVTTVDLKESCVSENMRHGNVTALHTTMSRFLRVPDECGIDTSQALFDAIWLDYFGTYGGNNTRKIYPSEDIRRLLALRLRRDGFSKVVAITFCRRRERRALINNSTGWSCVMAVWDDIRTACARTGWQPLLRECVHYKGQIVTFYFQLDPHEVMDKQIVTQDYSEETSDDENDNLSQEDD